MDTQEFMDDDEGFEDVSNFNLERNTKKADQFIKSCYKISGIDEVTQEMEKKIREVDAILHLGNTKSKLLLFYFKWDSLKLVEQYFAAEDPISLLKSAGIHVESEKRTHCDNNTAGDVASCGICLEDVTQSKMVSLACGHPFCESCWRSFLREMVFNNGASHNLKCPETECDVIIGEEELKSITSDPDLISKYRQLSIQSYILLNPKYKWCPAAGCEYIISADSKTLKRVECQCGKVFCFNCGDNWHSPLDCEYLKKWIEKVLDKDSSETSRYLICKTKPCPKCGVNIDKDGGCNHITCKNKGCGFEFCWVCLENWKAELHYNQCNLMKAQDGPEVSKSRAALKRFQFHAERYLLHQQSLKMEEKLFDTVEKNIGILQKEYHASWIECQFLKAAVQVLHKCRGTLMYSYAFSYFLASDNLAEIFRSNLADLHQSVESLSQYLEQDLEEFIVKEPFDKIKTNVVDKYIYCEKRRTVLEDFCQEIELT